MLDVEPGDALGVAVDPGHRQRHLHARNAPLKIRRPLLQLVGALLKLKLRGRLNSRLPLIARLTRLLLGVQARATLQFSALSFRELPRLGFGAEGLAGGAVVAVEQPRRAVLDGQRLADNRVEEVAVVRDDE